LSYPFNRGGSGTIQPKHGVGDEEPAASECSESAQSSSVGQDHKLTPNQSEFSLVLQQLNEIKDDICSVREDLENFKVSASFILSFSFKN